MKFKEKIKWNPTVEVRKFIKDLIEMENKEEHFEIATRIWERKQNPPLTKEEWKIICDIGEAPGFEKNLFSE